MSTDAIISETLHSDHSLNLDVMFYAHNYNQFIFDWISAGVNSEDRVLDFGAGRGVFANMFAGEIEAVEIDESLHPHICQKTYRAMSETDGVFDLIYSVNVLEHIEDDVSVVGQFNEKLGAEGRLKIFVPAFDCLYSQMDKAVGHVRRYSKDGLVSLLETNGFRVTHCRYFDSIGFFMSLLYKSLRGNGRLSAANIALFDRFIFPFSLQLDGIGLNRFIGKNVLVDAVKVQNIPK